MSYQRRSRSPCQTGMPCHNYDFNNATREKANSNFISLDCNDVLEIGQATAPYVGVLNSFVKITYVIIEGNHTFGKVCIPGDAKPPDKNVFRTVRMPMFQGQLYRA